MDDTNAVTPRLGIALGAVLVAVGVGAYVLSAFASVTALIPAMFGVVIVALGVLGSLRGVPDVVALLTGGDVDSVVGPVAMGTTILVGLVLLAAVARDLL